MRVEVLMNVFENSEPCGALQRQLGKARADALVDEQLESILEEQRQSERLQGLAELRVGELQLDTEALAAELAAARKVAEEADLREVTLGVLVEDLEKEIESIRSAHAEAEAAMADAVNVSVADATAQLQQLLVRVQLQQEGQQQNAELDRQQHQRTLSQLNSSSETKLEALRLQKQQQEHTINSLSEQLERQSQEM